MLVRREVTRAVVEDTSSLEPKETWKTGAGQGGGDGRKGGNGKMVGWLEELS